MPNSDLKLNSTSVNNPNYQELINFLIQPFCESSEFLVFDCEYLKSTKKIWIRLAIEAEDKGRIYGRGGRNIHAVKTVLQTAADIAGHILYLELYGEDKLINNSSDFASKTLEVSEKTARLGRRPLKRRPLVKPKID